MVASIVPVDLFIRLNPLDKYFIVNVNFHTWIASIWVVGFVH